MGMMINRNIAYLRRLSGLQQVELAQYLKVGRSTISNYEKSNTVPDAKAILELCEYFGISADYALFVDLEANGVLIDGDHKAYNVPGKSALRATDREVECEKMLLHTREILAAKEAHISSLEKLVEVLMNG